MSLPVLMDGVATPAAEASISVFDQALQRGLGCFEAMRSYGGCVFRMEHHLDRLDKSAKALGIVLPARATLVQWIEAQAVVTPNVDSAVRIFVTGGIEGVPNGSRVIVTAGPLPQQPAALRLRSVAAPWHPAGRWSELTGAKTTSYAPNMASRQRARSVGFDDALLLSAERVVLEGPTFTIGWVSEGAVFTPDLDLGILASITRAAVLEAAARADISVVSGRFTLDSVLGADEVLVLSTFKEVLPVVAVDDVELASGPVTARLAVGFRALVAEERR